ncbi:YjbQ family protein [Candidatus Aerophobetes bacterium]|jgi:secondary thiamine-phosphate synthase enzyme|uniref:YjbQ family protein n=1 Tax=Aerophobetes bacterium TaxID=2030807 RepID=A0A523QFX5_UNCAE|nr:MAG: YjbQ family protein [Candidatus Aerophobetes bacterium]
MTKQITVATRSKTELVDISSEIEKIVEDSGIKDGVCWVFVPHTTAGISINEGADPSVKRDILSRLDKLVPSAERYEHLEGNAPAHIKTSIVGSSETLIIEKGRLLLGTWQSLYLCEFDGPRHRKVIIKIK